MMTALSRRPPFLGPNMTLLLCLVLIYTHQLTHIGNEEFICLDGNCGHTGSQRGLINIGGCLSQGLMVYRKHFFYWVQWSWSQKPPMGELIVTLDGKPIDSFEWFPNHHTHSADNVDWLRKVWEEGVDFDSYAQGKYWFNRN